MNFNKHFELQGRHAILSASKYHWTNYDDSKLDQWFITQMAAQEGTELHDLAATLIKKRIRLPKSPKTFNRYVNDAIGYRMTPEQVLVYSANVFGTADAISFKREPSLKQDLLRIYDLKTGVSKASMRQLEIYAALFCLEYDIKPGHIAIDLRLYQNDDVEEYIPAVEDIAYIMDKIISFDRRIDVLKGEALLA